MLAEELEKSGILVFLQNLQVVRESPLLATTELQLAALLVIGANVKFGKMDVVDDSGILLNGSLNLLHARAIDIVVPLHTDSVNWHAGILHLLHHVVNAVALSRMRCAIVIIEKQRVRVGLASELEGLSNELIAAKAEMS